jgi:ATP-dependent helicase YprA (DUF1998 family)
MVRLLVEGEHMTQQFDAGATLRRLERARKPAARYRPDQLVRQAWLLVRRRLRHLNNLKLLAKVELHRGKLPLNLRRRADEYARDILGHRQHAAGLYVYAAMRRDFLDGWIPNSHYDDDVLPRICQVGGVARDRHLAKR